MMASAAKELPVGPNWCYEVKWDGYRTLAVKEGSRVTLLSRNLKNVTSSYPKIASSAGKLDVDSVMLDGEVVALDQHGRPSFQALQHRATAGLTLVY
jgi:bifunctional non-homologous end joining protein LigD